ncbi:MAG TPA: hypothetical protein VID47_13310 [Actinomycetota bacterium]|jgi:hypothetical protein
MAQQRQGFNFGALSTATKILLIASVVALVNSFIPWWQHVDVCGALGANPFGIKCSAGFSALGGSASWAGILMFIGLIALIAWEVMLALGTLSTSNLPMAQNQITLILVGWVVVFGLLKFLLALTGIFIGAFIGLICLIAIGYGGWMQYQEHTVAGPPPGAPPAPPAGSGGFSA